MYCPKCNSSNIDVKNGFFSNDCRCSSCNHRFESKGLGITLLSTAVTVVSLISGVEVMSDHHNHQDDSNHS